MMFLKENLLIAYKVSGSFFSSAFNWLAFKLTGGSLSLYKDDASYKIIMKDRSWQQPLRNLYMFWYMARVWVPFQFSMA